MASFLESFLVCMLGVAIIVTGSGVGYMALCIYSDYVATPQYHDVAIYSLSDTSPQIHGSFALGSGYISSYPVYSAYKQLPNGGYHRMDVFTDISNVFMDTDKDPYIRVWNRHASVLGFNYTSSDYLYEIHVPKGTIIKDYKIG